MTALLRGDRVLLERRRLDLKQETLASKINVDRSYISQIERNVDVNVGVKTIFALAEVLGVSPAYLLGLTENPLQGVKDEEEEEATGLPAGVVQGSRLVYEVPSEATRRLAQRLLTVFSELTDDERAYVVDIADKLRLLNHPRIIGDEPDAPATPTPT